MPQAMLNKKKDEHTGQGRHRRNPHHFLIAALRSPLSIGSIVPSSRGLSRAMASAVDVSKPGAVIELGAGTGVVTHALLKHGVPPEKLIVIEREEHLHDLLSVHFRNLNILRADAIELNDVLKKAGVKQVNAIVSSLPFLSMPKQVRYAIQQQMAQAIGDDGIIVQFTYGPKSPIEPGQLRQGNLRGKRMKLVVANVPPAHVWIYQRERRKKQR